jgi:hypothetical protein
MSDPSEYVSWYDTATVTNIPLNRQLGLDTASEQAQMKGESRRSAALHFAMKTTNAMDGVSSFLRAAAKIEVYLRNGTTGDET